MDRAKPKYRDPRFWVRYLLLAGVVVAAAWGVRQTIRLFDTRQELTQGAFVLETVAYTEPVKAAVAQKVDGSKGLFQASLLVIAALWTLVVAKKDEKRLVLGDWPEIGMFLIANGFFAMNWLAYSLYMDAMTAIHIPTTQGLIGPEDLVIADYRDARIEMFATSQVSFWVSGAVIAAAALVSAHVLKETVPCADAPAPSSGPSPALAGVSS
ncbi:MAG: hypothetical protein J2P46_12440 [Zavarzinella sp.]|nr:hypothetical protein [Zavarzinella sp.]